LRTEVGALGQKIAAVEQEIASLKAPPVAAEERAAEPTKPAGVWPGNSAVATPDSAPAPQDNMEAAIERPPLPRPRRGPQPAATAARPAAPAATPAGPPPEPKVGGFIVPGQFALQPVPEELESKFPQLGGMAFFRHQDRIFIVNPKDNKIIQQLN
jgi:hypothetical protein